MRRRRITIGAIVLMLAGLQYLAVETISAAMFSPAYDYANNYISDLGVPGCGIVYSGRELCSPLAALMNTGFIVDGILFFVASVLLAPLITGVLRYLLLMAAFLHGLGNVLVGLFNETTPAVGGPPSIHVVGALLAILFGNVAIILAGIRLLRLGRRPLGIIALALGSIGIIALVLVGADGAGLPAGLVERISVYPITSSELLFGAAVLVTQLSHRFSRRA